MRARLAVTLAFLAACGGSQKNTQPPVSAPTDTPDAGASTSAEIPPPPPPPPPTASDNPPTDSGRPAPLPPDTGKPESLKIVALKVSLQKGILRDNQIELKKNGTVWFDGKKLGKISKNKIPLTERPMETTVRSDGFLEETGAGFEKGLYLKMTDDTLINASNAATQLKPDGTIVAILPGMDSQPMGTVTGDLKTPQARRTALALIGVELARPPDFSAAQKRLDDEAKKMRESSEPQ